RTRFRQFFVTHLGQAKGSLAIAALCTIGVILTELAKPWPLKLIIDHGLLHTELPHSLGFLQPLIAGSTVPFIVVVCASILVISPLLTVRGTLLLLCTADWRLGAIALATMPLLGYSLFHVYRKTKISVKTQKKQEGQVAARMDEVLSAVPLVQAFARETHEMR